MVYEPSEAELAGYDAAYSAATKTAVIVAPGPLRPEMDGAFRGVLCALTLTGLPRIIIEDAPGSVVLELQTQQVVSARLESKFMSSDAAVEVTARGRAEVDDGQRECVVIAGPKRELKQAFASIGVRL